MLVKDIECHSFEYNAAKQTCSLKEAVGQPFGRSIILPSNNAGLAFYQQICVPCKFVYESALCLGQYHGNI